MWPGGENKESKGERQIQPVISSLSVLHSPEHTKRLTELGREETEKAMAPHSSTLAWKIPWVEEPGGLPSTGSHRVRTTEVT